MVGLKVLSLFLGDRLPWSMLLILECAIWLRNEPDTAGCVCRTTMFREPKTCPTYRQNTVPITLYNAEKAQGVRTKR